MIQRDFIWEDKKTKVKHNTFIAEYLDGGLKDIDIKAKIESLHLSWLKDFMMIIDILGKNYL